MVDRDKKPMARSDRKALHPFMPYWWSRKFLDRMHSLWFDW